MIPSKHHASRIWNDRGNVGKGANVFRWIVEGAGDMQLRYHSAKAAGLALVITLSEQRMDLSEEALRSHAVPDAHAKDQRP